MTANAWTCSWRPTCRAWTAWRPARWWRRRPRASRRGAKISAFHLVGGGRSRAGRAVRAGRAGGPPHGAAAADPVCRRAPGGGGEARGHGHPPRPRLVERSAVNALLYHLPRWRPIGGVATPGIVHRLDRDTSGLLVFANGEDAHQRLLAAMKDRQIQRRYVAQVAGELQGGPDRPSAGPRSRRPGARDSDAGRQAGPQPPGGAMRRPTESQNSALVPP